MPPTHKRAHSHPKSASIDQSEVGSCHVPGPGAQPRPPAWTNELVLLARFLPRTKYAAAASWHHPSSCSSSQDRKCISPGRRVSTSPHPTVPQPSRPFQPRTPCENKGGASPWLRRLRGGARRRIAPAPPPALYLHSAACCVAGSDSLGIFRRGVFGNGYTAGFDASAEADGKRC